MKIVGFHSGHDSSYAILDNGIPKVHIEMERYTRRKNAIENSMEAFLMLDEDVDNFTCMSTHRGGGMRLNNYMDSYDELEKIVNKRNGIAYITGHHQAHAANAFFTSNFSDALIVTIDGGGVDYIDGSKHHKDNIDREDPKSFRTCTTIWIGKDNKIEPVDFISSANINIGFYWANTTSKVFGLGTYRDPRGDQAGTVIGMAALGNSKKYSKYFKNIHDLTVHKNWGPTDYEFLKKEADESEQNRFDIAASLQQETEILLKNILQKYISQYNPKNLCLSGGASLNCIAIGKILEWFPGISVFCDPIPYDGGLSLGSARYLWHHVLDNPREYNNHQNQTPYLGYLYTKQQVLDAISKYDSINLCIVDDEFVVNELIDKKIVSVFGGRSESGRRALGNRSIIADPRHIEIKDIVNEKVKHRQWFRPFAPSILREDVKDWFKYDIDSPYMSFAIPFNEDKKDFVPAVVHFDGTARLQTVTELSNPWYYNFIKRFKEKTGVPIVLNTSFNDREPIVETPEHAINCFLNTNIDYLYFTDFGLLLNKK
jgi:carbamoyltransferase